MVRKTNAAKRSFHRYLPFLFNQRATPLNAWPRMERLEERTLLSVTVASSFSALDFNHSGGYTPPDTNGAAGPSAYVETVNQEVALYGNKATGTPATLASLSMFWFTTGGLAHADSGSGLSDPVVTYNDQIGRFIIADQDVNFTSHNSRFDIAVSKTSNPLSLTAADWTFYQFNSTEAVNGSTAPNEDADYPGNIGYNHDATVFTLNMFAATGSTGISGTNHTQVITLSNADLSANVSQASLHSFRNDLNDFALRPTTMHDSVAGDPMWLVTEHGDGASIDVIKMSNILSTSAVFAYTNLAVTPYGNADSPLNPNGTTVTTNIDSRIQKSAEWGNTLVAAHSVAVSATQDVIQWYQVNLSSGTPVLTQQGRVSAGNNTYLTYPGIDINSTGQIGLTYMKSGNDTSTDYLSMLVTGRNTSDASGTMQTPVVVSAGTGLANYKDFASGGRAGDLSGINVDPVDGSFWAANEFANTEATANWGTAVANFSITNPIASTDMAVTATGPSSITAGTNATYTITVTNNGPAAALGVVLSDLLPAGSTFVSMTQNSGADAFNLTQSGGSATETATANIASGSADVFTLVVSAPGNLVNGAAFNETSSVSEQNADTNTANNSAAVTGTVSNVSTNTDIAVTASGPSSIPAGTNATYTITVTNNGPNPSQGLLLSDTLQAGSSFVSMTKNSGSDSFTFGQSGGTITETAGANIASGSSDVFTLVVFAPGTLANGAAFNNTSSVSQTNPDSNTANNTAIVSGTVSNVNTNADLSVTVSGPATSTEGATVTYTITVKNNGPASAASTVLTNTLPSILSFKSATTTKGTFTTSSGVTTFALGSIAANGTVTATVTAQAIEDGSTSVLESVSSSNPDPNTVNNTASATTSFTEPAIVVSKPISTKSDSLSNFQVATFTHANGVEPASAFVATINWGDGTTSTGVITLSGTTYVVKGSHTFSTKKGNSSHTITTTVVEAGDAPGAEGGEKVDVDPGTLPLDQRDLVNVGDIKENKGHNKDSNSSSSSSASDSSGAIATLAQGVLSTGTTASDDTGVSDDSSGICSSAITESFGNSVIVDAANVDLL